VIFCHGFQTLLLLLHLSNFRGVPIFHCELFIDLVKYGTAWSAVNSMTA